MGKVMGTEPSEPASILIQSMGKHRASSSSNRMRRKMDSTLEIWIMGQPHQGHDDSCLHQASQRSMRELRSLKTFNTENQSRRASRAQGWSKTTHSSEPTATPRKRRPNHRRRPEAPKPIDRHKTLIAFLGYAWANRPATQNSKVVAQIRDAELPTRDIIPSDIASAAPSHESIRLNSIATKRTWKTAVTPPG